jgi:hypothetical protein
LIKELKMRELAMGISREELPRQRELPIQRPKGKPGLMMCQCTHTHTHTEPSLRKWRLEDHKVKASLLYVARPCLKKKKKKKKPQVTVVSDKFREMSGTSGIGPWRSL